MSDTFTLDIICAADEVDVIETTLLAHGAQITAINEDIDSHGAMGLECGTGYSGEEIDTLIGALSFLPLATVNAW